MPKYSYTTPQPGVFKPWIAVILNNRKTHKTTFAVTALVDSGADICLCEKYIGDFLGISFKGVKPKEFFAADGKTFYGFPALIDLFACSKVIKNCTFYFVEGLPKGAPIILGQSGFFENFKVTFDLKNKEIEIT